MEGPFKFPTLTAKFDPKIFVSVGHWNFLSPPLKGGSTAPPEDHTTTFLNICFHTPISRTEIKSAVNKLYNNKAAPDEIRNEMIKYGKEISVEYLHHLFSLCYDHHITPP